MAHQASIQPEMPPASHAGAGAGAGAGADGDPFDGFDGVHFARNPRLSEVPPRAGVEMPVSNPPKEQPILDADRGGELVYYPAPVPVMLNLPPKLSNTRGQNQSKASQVEAPRAMRESLTPLRRSLGLKASHSKADVSSMFDNILDATVASPVLSVVSHSVTSIKGPINSGHGRSASKFSMAPPRIGDQPTAPHPLGQTLAAPETGDGAQPHAAANVQTLPIVESSAIERESAVLGHDGVVDAATDSRSRASYYPHSSYSDKEDGVEGEERESQGGEEEDDAQFVPATLLAELESRKNQQRARTNKFAIAGDAQQAPTLLERDALAEVKHQARKRGPVNLAWQADQNAVEEEEDDVPLGLLFANKLSTRPNEVLRTPGLLAMREAEDNEPLRRRQERLKHTVDTAAPDPADEKETLGQRRNRLQAAQRQRDANSDRVGEREEAEATGVMVTGLNSMSAVLHSNPQKQSYAGPQDGPSRGLLNPELPFGYQAQQQMHVNFMGQGQTLSNRQSLLLQQRKPMPPYQYDYTALNKSREHEFGIPFPYAPVNAEYLQHQQTLLADQIERWRSSVW
ncbi:hypothetical protein DRE_07214 [Drechslerella stenobrocha 248]|uniref:Uncharacterized protein n=1 Tax=Drechslerella stenobrocha 248 TaxID=1043628 RepID=W7HLW0_9PEZI|nr:hypothetical protein DRE_07214 [Drechslerella stenobrocha 248]